MSFQAYIDNIQAKTGKSPEPLKKIGKKWFLQNGQLMKTGKTTKITDWLKSEFKLGQGHTMAIYATFKGKKD
ncbi:MAG: DUF4287 domain-containing protein [Chitinophagaceae bacterium]